MRLVSAAIFTAFFVVPAIAHAGDERAREAYDRGVRAHAAGREQEAALAFAEADAIDPSPAALEAALEASMRADDAVLGTELLDRAAGRPADKGVARSVDAAKKRFGTTGVGICYTRTGRRFFEDAALERLLLDRVRVAATAAGLWEELSTDWLCLDCELMPWSAKAQGLIRDQYARVGAAAIAGVGSLDAAIAQLASRGIDPGESLAPFATRKAMVDQYIAAYRRYCWPVTSIDDLRLAPFHLLASMPVADLAGLIPEIAARAIQKPRRSEMLFKRDGAHRIPRLFEARIGAFPSDALPTRQRDTMWQPPRCLQGRVLQILMRTSIGRADTAFRDATRPPRHIARWPRAIAPRHAPAPPPHWRAPWRVVRPVWDRE